MENELSPTKFEHCVIEFLTGLLLGQPAPLLTQIEIGNVEHLTRKEVRDLQERIKRM